MDTADWDRRYRDTNPVWGAAPESALVELVTALPAGRALDLGCGEGRHALWLALRAWQVTAVDLSRTALTRAVRAAAPLPRATRARLTWVGADVTTTEFDPIHDLVLVCHPPVSPESRRGFLRAAVGALRPGGTVAVLTFADPPPAESGDRFGCTPTEVAAELGTLTVVAESRPVLLDLPRDAADPGASGVHAGWLTVGFRGSVGSHLNHE